MALYVLLFLCLLCEIQSAPGESTTTVINIITTTSDSENFSLATTDIGETTTLFSDMKSASDSTTVSESFMTTDSAETAAFISGTELTTRVFRNKTSECAIKMVNVSKKYQELVRSKNLLDELFEQTMNTCHSFAKTKNHTIAEYTIRLAKTYLQISERFANDVELQNKTIQCNNNTQYEKYKISDFDEYKEKLEIVEILSSELGKMMVNETESKKDGEEFENNSNKNQSVVEKTMALFEELHTVVALNKEIKDLDAIRKDQFDVYVKSLKIRDLDEAIKTSKEIIKIQNDIIYIVKKSDSMKYLYDDEHMPKSNMIRKLLNNSNLEQKLATYGDILDEEYEEREIEEALIQLNTVIRPVVLGTIFVVGITGNAVLLLVFVRHKDMRTAPNVMIINLTISDILGLITNIFMYILEVATTDWTLGTAMCKLYRFSRYLAIGLNCYSITVISVQRFAALVNSLRCHFFGKYQPLLNVLFVWVLASAFASPYAMKAIVVNMVCWSSAGDDMEFFNTMLYLGFAVYCVVPFIIITVTSGVSSMRLRSSVRNMPGETIGHEKAMHSRVLSSNIFVGLIIVFAVSYMPYFVLSIYYNNVKIEAPYMTQKYFIFGLYCLIHSNACFNPIALYVVSAKYRKYMRIYLCCGYRIRKNSTESSGGSNTTIETRM